jgi:Zn-dependent peptidase ImmA (M78 family)
LLTTLESLEQHAADCGIRLVTAPLPFPVRGLYFAPSEFTVIALSAALSTSAERAAVLAEELGHYHTTPIDLFTASAPQQRLYERRAAAWAANELVPLSSIVTAWEAGVRSLWELAEYMDTTEEFVVRALELHAARCGPSVRVGDYLITFDLLHIREVS